MRVNVTRSAREMIQVKQLQALEASGAVREQGLVDKFRVQVGIQLCDDVMM